MIILDINFLVLGIGNGSDYINIVSNTNKDVVILEESTSEETLRSAADSVITNIKDGMPNFIQQYLPLIILRQLVRLVHFNGLIKNKFLFLVPRAIVNPGCTSEFSGSSSTFFLTEYVEPLGTNYYKVSPNYFYTGDGTRNLTIQEQVCLRLYWSISN